MKLSTKILAALVALIMTAAALLACTTPGKTPGGETDGTKKPAGSNTGVETEIPDERYRYPDEDLDGFEMKIFSIMGPVTTWLTFPYFTTEESSSKISSAVYNRNLSIEENLHCTIKEDNADNSNGELWVSLLADDTDEYQAGVDYSWASISRSALNYLIDFKSINTVNLDKQWWDSNLNDAFSINGHVYITSGSAMISSWDEIFVIYFNSKVAEDIGGINLYNEVKDGTWTFDRMLELITVTNNAIDDPGAENEHYGFATQAFYSVPSFMGTNEATYGIVNREGKIENNSTTTKFINTAIRLAETMSKSDSIYYGDNEINQMFANGETFFLHECIGAMTNMRDISQFDYGVLPMPKWNEESSYHSYSGAQYLLFVPWTNRNVEKTGTVLEAMMGMSDKTLKDVYIEDMLGQIYARTPDAATMLYDYILPNTLYDIGGRQGLSFNNLIPLVQAVPMGITDIKSLVDSASDQVQAIIDDVNNFNG